MFILQHWKNHWKKLTLSLVRMICQKQNNYLHFTFILIPVTHTPKRLYNVNLSCIINRSPFWKHYPTFPLYCSSKKQQPPPEDAAREVAERPSSVEKMDTSEPPPPPSKLNGGGGGRLSVDSSKDCPSDLEKEEGRRKRRRSNDSAQSSRWGLFFDSVDMVFDAFGSRWCRFEL